MNEFANTSNSSSLLKNNYAGTNAMKEALKRRKQKLIDNGSVSPDDTYSSKDPEPKDNG